MNRRLKKPVVYSLYGLAVCMLIGGIVLLEVSTDKLSSKEKDYQYVSKTGLEETDIPVVNTDVTMIRPYKDSDVKILTNYYDYKATEDEQKKSMIYYEDTYMPSNGVSYGKDSTFDVIAVLDGKVKKVKIDDILGNVITIEHDNGIISTYESVTDISVKEGDQIKQGDMIAKSSTSNIAKDLNNHLYFELTVNNNAVNPEKYYDKSVNEIGA